MAPTHPEEVALAKREAAERESARREGEQRAVARSLEQLAREALDQYSDYDMESRLRALRDTVLDGMPWFDKGEA